MGVFVAPPLRAYQASVRFNVAWPEPVWVPKDELSEVLSAFVTEVVARASSADASKQWGEWLAARLEDKKAAAKRDDIRLQLMLGQVAAENWEIVAKPLGAAVTALSGVLTDSEIVHSPGDLKSIAETVVDAERERAQGDRWRKVASKPADRMLLPFQRGYRLADQARAFLGLGARPLEDLREVLDGFDVALKPFHGPPLFRTAGVVSTQGRASVYYSQGEWGFTPTRFAVAAALGRLLADGPSITGAFGCAHGRQSR